MSTTEAPRAPEEAFAERMFGALIATMELACVHIGDRLGLYAALDAGGPQTSTQLAGRAGVDERYCREWLEQQAARPRPSAASTCRTATARGCSTPTACCTRERWRGSAWASCTRSTR